MLSAHKTWRAVAALLLALAVAPALAAPLPGDRPGRFDTDKWLAPDAEMVMAVNFRQILDSALVKKDGVKPLQDAINSNEQVKTVLNAIGLDPLKDLDSVLMSARLASARDVKALIVVRGRYNLEKVHTAAEAFAKKKPDQLKLSREGAVRLYEMKQSGSDKPMFAAFVDRHTLVITPTKEGTLDVVRTGGKKPVPIKDEMKRAMGRFTGKESLALAVVVNDEMKKALGKVPQAAEIAPKLRSLTGRFTLTDAATLAILINTDDNKAAAKLTMLLKQLKSLAELMVLNDENVGPAASEVLGAVRISAVKKDVSIDLKLTEAMMEKAGKKDK
jgi:hypothetical protein